MKIEAFFLHLILAISSSCFNMDPKPCTGNKKVYSYSEYLEAFRKGPCSPILFNHGLLGASLRVQVDCIVLRSQWSTNDDLGIIWRECPFMCRGTHATYENTIWVTQSPMWKYLILDDFNFVWKNRQCAFFLLRVHWRKSQMCTWDPLFKQSRIDTKFEIYEIPGVQVRLFGDTESTKALSNCGKYGYINFAGVSEDSRGSLIGRLQAQG